MAVGETEVPHLDAPRAFMSYSHDDPAHLDWVLQLATRLCANGVDVILDQWDIVAGRDLPHFMEYGLSESKHVIVISSAKYVLKANERQRGVGYEARLITADLFSGARDPARIIPVIRNNDGDTALVPGFLGSLKYVDMRSDLDYEAGYEDLLRSLLGVPKAAKPKLGTNPFHPRKGEPSLPLSMRSERYVSPALEATVTFAYENNDGRYVIGSGDMSFTTRWTTGGPGRIYVYSDGPDVFSVAIADRVQSLDQLTDVSVYDASSRYRFVGEGEVAVFRNQNDYYAAVALDLITVRSQQQEAILRFRYRIQPNRTPIFNALSLAEEIQK